MKNTSSTKNEGFKELTLTECQEIEGGFLTLALGAAALVLSAYMVGLQTGRSIF